MGHMGTRPYDGLRPYTPQNDDGMRIDPAPSEPWASGPNPAAVAAPAPALEPPVVIAVFQGLRVMPVSGLSPSPFQPNSGVVVLPSITPPAFRRRRTTGGSTSGTRCSKMYDPDIVRTPFVKCRSLMENGMPCSGPSAAPFTTACSAARAAAIAASAVTVQKALMTGLRRSTRSSTARVSSTGESFLERISATSSVAGVKHRSAGLMVVLPRLLLGDQPVPERQMRQPRALERVDRILGRAHQRLAVEVERGVEHGADPRPALELTDDPVVGGVPGLVEDVGARRGILRMDRRDDLVAPLGVGRE